MRNIRYYNDVKRLAESKGLSILQVALCYDSRSPSYFHDIKMPYSDEEKGKILKAIDEAEKRRKDIAMKILAERIRKSRGTLL